MSPQESPPDTDRLAEALSQALGETVAVTELRRLTGGASRETWSFTAGAHELILRRDPPGRRNPPERMRIEAAAMAACGRAGLRVPEVVLHDDGELLGTAALVMRRVPGETIPRRILRDERHARARDVLVTELGQFLAGLHAIDTAEVPGADERDPIEGLRSLAQQYGDHIAVFRRAFEWLETNRPPAVTPTLVHGDLRLGNLIVGDDGLEAVIDWEVLHLGDPLEDLAWLCVKAWRFGEPLEVGGLGTIDELVTAYEGAGAGPVDRDAFHWWLVLKTLVWGYGCLAQGHSHLSGAVRSVELAVVGRRVAEQEWDLIELLAPEATSAALAAPPPARSPDDAPYGRPSATELLEAVAEFLSDRVVARRDELSYHARVAVTALEIVQRELAQVRVAQSSDDWASLALDVRDRLAVANPRHLER